MAFAKNMLMFINAALRNKLDAASINSIFYGEEITTSATTWVIINVSDTTTQSRNNDGRGHAQFVCLNKDLNSLYAHLNLVESVKEAINQNVELYDTDGITPLGRLRFMDPTINNFGSTEGASLLSNRQSDAFQLLRADLNISFIFQIYTP